MNKISKNIIRFFAVLSFVGILIFYPILPERIPIQWNYNWEVSKMGQKQVILLLGALPLLILILFRYLPKIDPKGENYKRHENVYELIKHVLAVFLILLNWITVAVAFEVHLPFEMILNIVFGVFFVIFGNYLPKFKSNYFIGIRNPWVLSDDTVWRKTHKAGGYIFTSTGLLFIISAFLQYKIFYMGMFYFLLVSIACLNLYSYLLYKRIHKIKRKL
ncbi:hypothetical protein acsn021_31920 [Anaerocolumna cellulosilytica]|uniref:DUF1648 domain-containing protein n=1 Tax=Anaerocolumna cellulosilytica TaxID=433286 RepID=A0A6S6QWM3_9FIRM|nr:SdpI family protein [Anaerocolumna cellulosilytica]MBB5196523.1 putative membrane protein [Anaerocolumna cellulosilytica]BCJ95623.1 hypothetical protein acsn021_31920 [Anaerocolumna cellulosilytica]